MEVLMAPTFTATSAVIMFLACTSATLLLTVMWALATRRPVRAHAHLTGRPSVPYWYTPTGWTDDRGIVPLPDRAT
jgi:hypothetical protein